MATTQLQRRKAKKSKVQTRILDDSMIKPWSRQEGPRDPHNTHGIYTMGQLRETPPIPVDLTGRWTEHSGGPSQLSADHTENFSY